jgi:hypothetical protein
VELEKMSEFLEHEAFPVRKFCDLRKNVEEMTWEVLCAWRGIVDEESTWEPVAVMEMDTPEVFDKFLHRFEDQEMAKQVRST